MVQHEAAGDSESTTETLMLKAAASRTRWSTIAGEQPKARKWCGAACVLKAEWDLTVAVYGFHGCAEEGGCPWQLEALHDVAALPRFPGSQLLRKLRLCADSSEQPALDIEEDDPDSDAKDLDWRRLLEFGQGKDLGGVGSLSECRIAHGRAPPRSWRQLLG